MADAAFRALLTRTLERYRAEVADETDDLGLLQARLVAGDALEDRRTWPGHVTTSAVVFDPAGREVLLVRHRATGRWLQPGGHWEPGPGFAASAAREAREETGVAELVLHAWHRDADLPIDIDTHAIPARPARNEPAHHHFDLRFAFVAPRDAALRGQEEEVSGVAWRPLGELEAICPRILARLRLRQRGR